MKPRPVGLPPAGWRVKGAQEPEARAPGGAGGGGGVSRAYAGGRRGSLASIHCARLRAEVSGAGCCLRHFTLPTTDLGVLVPILETETAGLRGSFAQSRPCWKRRG